MKIEKRELKEVDRNLAQEIIEAYNDENVDTILINGFDNEDKIIDTFLASEILNRDYDCNEVMIRVSTLESSSRLINKACFKYGYKTNIHLKLKGKSRIFGMEYSTGKYGQDYWMPIRNDLSIYFPVEGVISLGSKSIERFKQSLQNDKSTLKVIVTTNDWGIKTNVLDGLIDKYLLLDCSIKYPDTYRRILDNMSINKLPYE